MAQLSPAAQAVLDAIQDELDATAEITPRSGSVAAAALRAAAEQLRYHIAYDDGEPDYKVDVADLLAIAAELEQAAHNSNTTEATS